LHTEGAPHTQMRGMRNTDQLGVVVEPCSIDGDVHFHDASPA